MRGILKDWEKMTSLPVAVLGGGVTGQGVCSLLKRLGWNYRIFEDTGIELTPNKLRSSAIVVVSPGFRPDHRWLVMAREMKIKVLGELDFASCFLSSPVTAITGTNGKTTLATLLTHALNKLGTKTKVAGNVGYSLSQLIADSISLDSRVILEVSSFQSRGLCNLKAENGIWTNFAEDHLNYHASLEDYFLSKFSLLKMCEKEIFVGKSVQSWAERLSIKLPGQAVVVPTSPELPYPRESDHFLNTWPQRENFSLALAYTRTLGLADVDFVNACEDYIPEPHRLNKVSQIEEVSFWNDSKATNFESTIAACRSMKSDIFWIGGGQSKGVQVDEFSRQVSEFAKKSFTIGEVGEELASKISSFGSSAVHCFSLREAVECAYAETNGKAAILFSPGFASFDQFKDYNERGDLFNQYVFDLKKRFASCTKQLLY
jgi:UDP-N-acetylmuramoylalanine--D-glutamate ligase